MKWLPYVALAACASCLSCSSDGGPVGTGISSTAAISGNIVDVQTSTATGSSSPGAAVSSIEVSIDGLPNVHTVADENGNFVLTGAFSGTVTMRFVVPQFQVAQQLDVPAGSTVVLQDIELQPEGVAAQAARQLDFFGTVDFIDCSDGTLLVHERRSGGMQYHVQLHEETSLVDAAGRTQTCAGLRVGDTVIIEGTIAYTAPGGTISALVVALSPVPPPPPQQQLQARFSGILAALDCGAGFVVVDDSVQRTTVQLTAQTQLGGVLTCPELQLGDPVRGAGQITLRMPGVIVAARLDVTGPPSSKPALRFVGFVTTIDCASGTLQLADDHTTIDVRLSSATKITTRNGQPLSCTDIQSGDRIEGDGQLTPGPSGTLDAAHIVVRQPGVANPFEH